MRLILTPEQLLVDDRKLSSYFRFADHPSGTRRCSESHGVLDSANRPILIGKD
jgi:hypothetical protein